MSKFEAGNYKIEISDKYESEEMERYGGTCFEVKRRDSAGYSALIFLGVMPEKMTTKRELCSSKDMWHTLYEEWLPKGDIAASLCGPRTPSKYENRDGWYDITIGCADSLPYVRRIVHDLDGEVTLNFATRADTNDASEHKFLEDLADTTKAVITD